MNSFKDFNIKPVFPLHGVKESILNVKNKPIIIRDFRILTKTEENETFEVCQIQFTYIEENVERVTFTRSNVVKNQLQAFNPENLPVLATFKEKDNCLYIE